ncbi:hypothetical protein [Pseudomonas helmanticensis]|uniref:hypothetical protein n=1 Tax=Pseudomonas helmanticensis TaxID=1471381 RepID=UPI0038298D54
MESKFIKVLVGLGVPGVALGIFYLLLRSFNFEFSSINPTWSAIIVVLFLSIVGGVTVFALHRWSPEKKEIPEVKSQEARFTFKSGEEEVLFEEKMISLSKDVVKVFAHTHFVGVAAEYAWVEHKYPGYKRLMQSISSLELLTKAGKEKEIYFDILKIELADGRVKEIYFDVSEFLRPGFASSLNNKDAFIASKLGELYS